MRAEFENPLDKRQASYELLRWGAGIETWRNLATIECGNDSKGLGRISDVSGFEFVIGN